AGDVREVDDIGTDAAAGGEVGDVVEGVGAGRGVGDGKIIEVVAAAAARERVAAAAATQDVVAAVADDCVDQPVAVAIDICAAAERQVLEVGAQRVVDGAGHLVGAGVGRFGHLVAAGVDGIAVVAGAAGHDVGAEPAVQRVGAVAPADGVVALRAGDLRAAAGDACQDDEVGPGEIGQAGSDAVVDLDRLDVHHAVGGECHV